MARYVSDCLRIMRLVLGRRNVNDSDSSDSVFKQYLQDFVSLHMGDDIKVFEKFGAVQFNIDDTVVDSTYSLADLNLKDTFTNISTEGFIYPTTTAGDSYSYMPLEVCLDPHQFYNNWGVENYTLLNAGMPSEMLYYNDTFVFRTIPDQEYTVILFAYRTTPEFDFDDGDPEIPEAYWLRYIAYGAALLYMYDYRYSQEDIADLNRKHRDMRMLLAKRMHSQNKLTRGIPRY